MNTKHETEQWLSPEEVAEATGLDLGEIRHYAALGNFPQGQLRATYGGSAMHWKKQDVDVWLASLAPQYVTADVIKIRPNQTSDLPPACVDCQHAMPAKSDLLCASPAAPKQISLVTGEQVGNWCSSLRSLNGECGLDGRLFIRRETSQQTMVEVFASAKTARINFSDAVQTLTPLSATERNNLRFLQRMCLAAIEDIEDATCTYGIESKESTEVTDRYKQLLGEHFVQILGSALKNLDRDLG